jgi:hypothetical protein
MRLPCSELSESLAEDMAGSAPAETKILVIEQSGPWGRDAVAESGLRPIADQLAARAKAAGARIQVVRRSTRRYVAERRHAWVADIERNTLARWEVTEPEELLELPFDVGGWDESQRDPLWLACTHSTRDPCCARRGLPLHRGLRLAGADVWHASHLGGHRFAPTMATLPSGLWLGRVPPDEAAHVLETLRDGRLPLPYMRGRAGRSPAAQAAELAIRRAEGLDHLDDVTTSEHAGDVEVAAADGRRWTVTVRHEPTAHERPLSCGPAAKVEDPGRWVVAAIR